jgi:hypothetical protein
LGESHSFGKLRIREPMTLANGECSDLRQDGDTAAKAD